MQITEQEDSELLPVNTAYMEEDLLPADTLALTEEFERAVEEQALAAERQEKELDFEEALLAEATRSVQNEVSRNRQEEELPKIAEPEEDGHRTVTKLSREQREIFSYFVPIKGMERQLCQALTGAAPGSGAAARNRGASRSKTVCARGGAPSICSRASAGRSGMLSGPMMRSR